jgi:anti-sigma factor RsiW
MTFCDEILEQIDAIAGGDHAPDERTAAHLATCVGCAKTLEDARRIDRLLQVRPAPQAPAQFTTRTLTRVRRERWQREQAFDIAFNVVVGLVLIAGVAATWLFVDLSGLSIIGQETVSLVSGQIAAVVRAIAPSVGGYAAATGLLLMVLAIWWWAERGMQY